MYALIFLAIVVILSLYISRRYSPGSFLKTLLHVFGPPIIVCIFAGVILVIIGKTIENSTDLSETSATLLQLQTQVDALKGWTEKISLTGWKSLIAATALAVAGVLFGFHRIIPLIKLTGVFALTITMLQYLFLVLASVTYFGTEYVSKPMVTQQLRWRNEIEERGKILGIVINDAEQKIVDAGVEEVCNEKNSDDSSVCGTLDTLAQSSRSIRSELNQIQSESEFSDTNASNICKEAIEEVADDYVKQYLEDICRSKGPTPITPVDFTPKGLWLKPVIETHWNGLTGADIKRLLTEIHSARASPQIANLAGQYAAATYDLASEGVRQAAKTAITALAENAGLPKPLIEGFLDATINEQVRSAIEEGTNRAALDWLSGNKKFEDILKDVRTSVADTLKKTPAIFQKASAAAETAAKSITNVQELAAQIKAKWANTPDSQLSRRMTNARNLYEKLLANESGKKLGGLRDYTTRFVRETAGTGSLESRSERIARLEAKLNEISSKTGDTGTIRMKRLELLSRLAGSSAIKLPDGIISCECSRYPGIPRLCFRYEIGSPC